MSSLFQKAKYAAETLKDVAKTAITEGEILVGAEEAKARMDICKGCEFYTELLGKPKCNECGCFMALKTDLKAAKCPVSKW